MSRHKNEHARERGDVAPFVADSTGPVAGEGAVNSGNDSGIAATPGSGAKKAVATEAEASAVANAEAAAAALESAQCELKTARAELAELNDKYLRKLAEEVNFRKRMMREKDEALKYGVSTLINDIIPVLDDFDRAIASAEQAHNYEQLHDGIVLIRRQLGQMLENRYYLKRVPSTGALFDPNMHEAVAAESADVDEAVVGEEFLPGYVLHDRVLRTAKVRVLMPAPEKAPSWADPAAGNGAVEDGTVR